MMKIICEEKDCQGKCSQAIISMAEEILSIGELIVYPTETLYGIGGDALDFEVVNKINEIKGAPEDKKLSTAYSSIEQAREYIGELPEIVWDIADSFLPGPITIVVAVENTTEGIRVPDHPLVRAIIDRFGPITSTSANKHGAPSAYDIETAETQLGNDIKLYLDCGPCRYSKGSTIVLVDDQKLEILREGVISKEEIGDVIGF